MLETSLLKTLLFNLRYFGAKGFRFPVLVSRNIALKGLGGRVELGRFTRGCVRLGYSSLGIVDSKHERGIWNVARDGVVVFRGKAQLAHATRIGVATGARLEMGKGFHVTGRTSLVCQDSVTFGDGVLVSWDCLIMDSDFHSFNGSERSCPIRVGDHVWIGCRTLILKGTSIPSGCVVAAGSRITKEHGEKKCLIAGANKVVARGIEWAE